MKYMYAILLTVTLFTSSLFAQPKTSADLTKEMIELDAQIEREVQNLVDLLAAAGLELSTIDSLPGDPLTVKIWIGEKRQQMPAISGSATASLPAGQAGRS